jgi:hypothetical protein
MMTVSLMENIGSIFFCPYALILVQVNPHRGTLIRAPPALNSSIQFPKIMEPYITNVCPS